MPSVVKKSWFIGMVPSLIARGWVRLQTQLWFGRKHPLVGDWCISLDRPTVYQPEVFFSSDMSVSHGHFSLKT